jgi:cephalosporin-C deacetylase-like acetyl esterase
MRATSARKTAVGCVLGLSLATGVCTLSRAAEPLRQERTGTVRVRVSPDRPDWLYSPGQQVRFRVTVTLDEYPLTGAEVKVRIGPEMMPPTIEKTLAMSAGGLTVDGGTMKEPGFLRCIATVNYGGKTYRGIGGAGFSPEAIQPTTEDPPDFDAFWSAGKEALAKIPVNARLTLLPEYCTSAVNVYHVNLQNVPSGEGASRLYGILCEPKAEGKYPALLDLPGAGVQPYRGQIGFAEKGIITFQMGIHGIPVNLDPSVYESLSLGALSGYMTLNLDNRDRYYFRRVYLGCVRANDFLTSLPKWDGRHLAVRGASQGGALSIVTAALDPRVTGLAVYFPGLCDLTGYLKGRAGGGPPIFIREGPGGNRTKEKIEVSRYYDAVNFGKRVKVPGIYTWGFNDESCPPTSMFAAYNVIPGPKTLLLALEAGHFSTTEQTERVSAWLERLLKGQETPK